MLTTQKDLVKLPALELAGRPLWAVQIELAIESGAEWLEAAIERLRGPASNA